MGIDGARETLYADDTSDEPPGVSLLSPAVPEGSVGSEVRQIAKVVDHHARRRAAAGLDMIGDFDQRLDQLGGELDAGAGVSTAEGGWRGGDDCGLGEISPPPAQRGGAAAAASPWSAGSGSPDAEPTRRKKKKKKKKKSTQTMRTPRVDRDSPHRVTRMGRHGVGVVAGAGVLELVSQMAQIVVQLDE